MAALLLGALIPTAAQAGSGPECIYEPSTMQGFGCTSSDFEMINLKIQLAMADQQGDMSMWNALRQQMESFEFDTDLAVSRGDAEPLHVRAATPLIDVQTLSMKRAGDNIKFATAPNTTGGIMPRLLMWDRLGRPMKVSGLSCTSTAGHYFSVVVSIVGGAVAGDAALSGFAAWQLSVPRVVSQAGGAVTALGMAELMGIPDANSCTVLVDVLHTFPGGRQGVYRSRLVVSQDGDIQMKPQRFTGLVWWFLGFVDHDEDGHPVW